MYFSNWFVGSLRESTAVMECHVMYCTHKQKHAYIHTSIFGDVFIHTNTESAR